MPSTPGPAVSSICCKSSVLSPGDPKKNVSNMVMQPTIVVVLQGGTTGYNPGDCLVGLYIATSHRDVTANDDK